MARENDGDREVVRLGEFEGELEEHWSNVRGRKVVDKSGDEVGSVVDVYVWKKPGTVHLIKVSGGERSFLVPIDAVTNVTEKAVMVEEGRDRILGSPEFGSEDVPDPEARRAAYGYYGYPDALDLGGV